MQKLSMGWLACVSLWACSSGDASAPAQPSVDTPPRATSTPAAKAETVAAPTPTHDVAREDWLLWHRTAAGITTRWLAVGPTSYSEVASRNAAIVGDGDRMWRLEPRSATAPTSPCSCADHDRNADDAEVECKPTGTLRTLGVTAIDLASGASIDVVAPSSQPIAADEAERTLELVGSAGHDVMIGVGNDGDFCGGRVEYRSVMTFDLATGRDLTESLGEIGKAMPTELREDAARKILAEQRTVGCNEGDAIAPLLAEMELAAVRVHVAQGKTAIDWSFEVFQPRVCSLAERATGVVRTDVIAAAAPVGLAGPLPAGLRRAIAELGDADAIGFGKLALAADARATALARFEAVAEAAFPRQESKLALSGRVRAKPK